MTTTDAVNRNDYSTLRVLVVDDHFFLRTAAQRMLLSLGVTDILQAGDGQSALAILQGENAPIVDMVLCDLDMPGMDGMEFMRHLSLHRDYALSVIIVSGLDAALINSVEKMTTAYGLRLLGAIEKPLSLAKLEALLQLHFQPPETVQLCMPEFAPNLYSLAEILDGIEQGQFEAFFQPKVSFTTGQVVGMEALARWRHPLHGLVGPYHFIGVLEKAQKMEELTFLMLKNAAVAGRLLQEAGYDISVSVNLSLISLCDVTLLDRIVEVVRTAGVEPKKIILEVTESTAMTDTAHALENLTRLRMRGFGLSIDDYGTGYSNMQQLSRIAFTELKIDASFVKDLSRNKSLRIIVESSIDMAHKLRVESVAEGVESQSDWDTLKEMGCDVAQGYFIARPMAQAAMLEFCATH